MYIQSVKESIFISLWLDALSSCVSPTDSSSQAARKLKVWNCDELVNHKHWLHYLWCAARPHRSALKATSLESVKDWIRRETDLLLQLPPQFYHLLKTIPKMPVSNAGELQFPTGCAFIKLILKTHMMHIYNGVTYLSFTTTAVHSNNILSPCGF